MTDAHTQTQTNTQNKTQKNTHTRTNGQTNGQTDVGHRLTFRNDTHTPQTEKDTNQRSYDGDVTTLMIRSVTNCAREKIVSDAERRLA